MTLTLTARTDGSTGNSPQQAMTSATFTPAANSKLYVFVVSQQFGHADTTRDWSVSGGGLTWTTVAATAIAAPWSGDPNFGLGVALFQADVGGSPPANMSVTVDADVGTTFGYTYSWSVFDVAYTGTGIQFAQSAVLNTETKDATDSEALTVTFGSAAMNGNLIVASFGVGNDGFGETAIPTGFAALVSQDQVNTHVGIFHRDDFTGTAVTSTDLGQVVGAAGGVLIELNELGSGGGDTLPIADPVVILDDVGVVHGSVIDGAADLLGLTDTFQLILTGLSGFADPVGITDDVEVVLGTFIDGAADPLGITDDVTLVLTATIDIQSIPCPQLIPVASGPSDRLPAFVPCPPGEEC